MLSTHITYRLATAPYFRQRTCTQLVVDDTWVSPSWVLFVWVVKTVHVVHTVRYKRKYIHLRLLLHRRWRASVLRSQTLFLFAPLVYPSSLVRQKVQRGNLWRPAVDSAVHQGYFSTYRPFLLVTPIPALSNLPLVW
jgi:hypothetical protein